MTAAPATQLQLRGGTADVFAASRFAPFPWTPLHCAVSQRWKMKRIQKESSPASMDWIPCFFKTTPQSASQTAPLTQGSLWETGRVLAIPQSPSETAPLTQGSLWETGRVLAIPQSPLQTAPFAQGSLLHCTAVLCEGSRGNHFPLRGLQRGGAPLVGLLKEQSPLSRNALHQLIDAAGRCGSGSGRWHFC